MIRSRWGNRFSEQDQEPLGPLANLIDIVLVFACGLIAALMSQSNVVQQLFEKKTSRVEKGVELPSLPEELGEEDSGYESVGRVYKDPTTGKLFMVEKETVTKTV